MALHTVDARSWGVLRCAWGRNWSGMDPPLSLQPRLPHGHHCFLSSSHVLVAIGPLCSPFVSLSLPPWLGFGVWAPGFWALSPGHITLVLSPGRGVHSGYHVWTTCASVVLAGAVHTPYAQRVSMVGSRCERSSVSCFGCCHQPWRGCRSLG